ncbi:MAG: type III pantothenate kinase [Flavobacteriales bacterium]
MNATNNTHLIIDQGNTLTKCALFVGREVQIMHTLADDQIGEFIESLPASIEVYISSVRSSFPFSFPSSFHVSYLDRNSKIPIAIDYETPETLGFDRIANACGLVMGHGKSSGLVIDCGTCITSTLITDQTLRGGSISPGLSMRLNALHQFTGRLPLIHFENQQSIILGKNTKESILAGTVGGCIREIEGIIADYCSHYGPLDVILTGGDGPYLVSQLKSPIFADSMLTLKGINEIYLHNRSEKNT